MAKEATLNYAELCEQLAAGNQVALKALYNGLGSQLYQFSFSIVHQREVAEEVVQDVFIQVWKNREKLREATNLRLYFFVATRNASISQLRKSVRHKAFSLEDIKLPFLKIDVNPEDQLINNDLLHRMNLAVNNLPQQCRLIFKLVKQDGFRYREVAELLQVSIKTVENQVGIALKKLHAAFPTGNQDKKTSTGS